MRVPAVLWLAWFVLTGIILATTNNVTRDQTRFVMIGVWVGCGVVLLCMRTMDRWYPEEAAAARERVDQARQMPGLRAFWHIFNSQRVPLVFFIVMIVGLINGFLSVKYPWLP